MAMHRAGLAACLTQWLAILGMGAWSALAAAGVTPEVSRIVFAADAAEQSLQVYNVNKYPVLVQAWIDDGSVNALPQESAAPILTIPPIFRMAPGRQTSLRMINTGAPLPTDRESLFWLNLYEIPETPKETAVTDRVVTITMRTQNKVFVRPAGLPYRVSELPGRLVFSLASAAEKPVLTIDNPTPYHATIAALEIETGGVSQPATVEMIPPFSSAKVDLNTPPISPQTPVKIRFSLLNDDGNAVAGERKIVRDAKPEPSEFPLPQP